MTTEQAEEKIRNAGCSVDTFWDWMRGQTMGLNDDGTTDVYDYDVDRFIRYKGKPKNETAFGFD